MNRVSNIVNAKYDGQLIKSRAIEIFQHLISRCFGTASHVSSFSLISSDSLPPNPEFQRQSSTEELQNEITSMLFSSANGKFSQNSTELSIALIELLFAEIKKELSKLMISKSVLVLVKTDSERFAESIGEKSSIIISEQSECINSSSFPDDYVFELVSMIAV